MKLYAVTFGCFRTTCVAASPEAALTDALYDVRPWYIDVESLGATMPPVLGRHACKVNEVEQRPYIKTLDKEQAPRPNSYAVACRELGITEEQLKEALTKAYTGMVAREEIRTQAPASQEATSNPISKGEHKE